jgi:K319-like protein
VFDGVSSRDPESGLLPTYRWDVTESSGKAVTTLYGKGATFHFPASKTYNVKLTVTDDDARSSSKTVTVVP